MKEPYTMEPHNSAQCHILNWPVCCKCGLVYLKNPFTAWAIKKGCNHTDHPDYSRQMRMHTKLGG